MPRQAAQAATQAPAQTELVLVQTPGVPQTIVEVRALRAQRSELSNQLTSALRRRNDVVEQLGKANASERPGLEARLKVLDDRIVTLEAEISRTGQLMSQTPGQLLGSTAEPTSGGSNVRPIDGTAIAVIFTIFVLAPLAFTAARLLWKRAQHAPPRLDAETQERMRRLEAGVDAIAIEVERISEGQRFVTRLLAEREKQQQALPR
ncbi:MAG: hypothetical protein KF689_10385 [Gemmatimonadaceae bacterium]|nr:hypothetical protein [Gemmatimonadaceae bacterium]MCW5825995.1 hypothetical protein [Gemmatimonadaceae bacterium]